MDYSIGSIIEYRTFTGGLRRVRVTEKDDDIKNGRAGFGGELTVPDPDMPGDGVWGYDSQIVRVVS